MPNPRLTLEQTKEADALLESIRAQLAALSGGDPKVLFAYRRRIFMRLSYDERSTPGRRKKLKMQKRKEQGGKCAICSEDLPVSGSELDRHDATGGYTAENTQLVHHDCHRKQQSERRFT